MTGRKGIVGLCLLCALAFSAFAAQSASAVTKGTTAFTCKKLGAGNQFKTDHCKTVDGASGEYGHVAVTQGVTTEITGTNDKTNASTTAAEPTLLHSVISGIVTQLTATGVHGTGTMTNSVDPTGEHYAHGEGVIEYTGVTVSKPAGKGCLVKTGKVTTKKLTATTTGQGHALLFKPAEGTVFATFEVEGCSVAALNGLYEVKGEVSGTPEGATTDFDEAATTTQGKLTLRGQKAGIDGKLTISGRANGTETTTPLTTTTVETP